MRTYRLPMLTAAIALLAACGGGDDTPAAGGGGGGGGGTVSTASAAENTARLADLNTFRSQCGGSTALATVSSHDALIIAAIKHAGYQALYNAAHGGSGLRHDEPESNALFVNTSVLLRVRAANGGSDISGWSNLYEGVSSQSGQAAINSLWNTVYHRLPMMRHNVVRVGYGDKAMARSDYPSASVSAGNGYATLDYIGLFSAPSITDSFWPKTGVTGVPASFSSNSESPDPVPGLDVVGPPIHAIFPTTSNFSSINVTLMKVSDSSHVSLRVMVGGSLDPVAGGDATDANTVTDASLDAGEIFLIPLSALAAGSNYTYTITATADVVYNVAAQTFTTAP